MPALTPRATPVHADDTALLRVLEAYIEALVNGAAIFLKSGAAKFPSLAGRRSAMGVIGASVL